MFRLPKLPKTAKTVEEARELIESGFEYVTDLDSCKLFRKRKTSYLGTESFRRGPWSSLEDLSKGEIPHKSSCFGFLISISFFWVEA